MKAQELFLKNGNSANIWYCSECKIVARKKEDAAVCCVKHTCSYCGKTVKEKHHTAHISCIERNKVSKAEKLNTWDGWVFHDDKYYETIEELVEELDSLEEKVPEFVYVCKKIPFKNINIGHLLEKIEESSYEGIENDLLNVADLSEAVFDFNESNSHLVSYLPDDTKMVKTRRYINEC